MKRTLAVAVVALTLMSFTLAQEAKPVTIKGHTLGESVSQFVKAIDYDLGECPRIVKLTPKEAKKQKILDVFNAMYPACVGFTDAQNGHPLVVLMNYGDNPKGRLQLQLHSDTTTVGQFTDLAAVIEKQKLVEFWVRPNRFNYTFDDIVAELDGKYGKPVATKIDTVQNGYGAQMKLGSGRWVLADGTVIVVAEEMVHAESAGYAKIITAGYFTSERWAELANQKKPSALD